METRVLAFSATWVTNAMNSDKIRYLWLWDAKGEARRKSPSSAEPSLQCCSEQMWHLGKMGRWKKSDTMIIPRTDTEINRNLISVLQWCVISHGCWAWGQISADQKSKLQPTWEGEDMHLDNDATKQKDISKWKCLLPLSLAPKCGLMLM